MRARFASLPPRALLAIGVGAVLLYAMVVWFLLVSPKRAEATTLSEDVVAAELRLAEARATASRPTRPAGTRVSDVLRLAKAMPASTDQPGLLLELELLGRATGVQLGSITLQEPVINLGGPTAIPVVVTVDGSYRQVTRFVRRARELVRVRGGEVRATGRLFTVQAVEIAESKAHGFPRLDAAITLNSFVYDGPLVPVTPPPPPAPSDDSSTSTTAARGTR
jgi:Tfp pilus assembly protein PilO